MFEDLVETGDSPVSWSVSMLRLVSFPKRTGHSIPVVLFLFPITLAITAKDYKMFSKNVCSHLQKTEK